MSNRNSSVFIFFMLFVFLCGSLMFLSGFFPDAYVKGDIDQSDIGAQRPTAVKGLRITPPAQKYQQIILMIVDALGFSFVNPTNSMPFVHMNRCERLKLRVAIPTVTMPRIKSLMTGTISNFIDILRNLGETEQLTDSLLHVLNKHNRLINFAGDRTWTGLFPSEFTRKRATMDSFFVQDFYEGDRQVIETLRQEIDELDWSLLILHFLGFDHIGHVEGSESVKIADKLKEMDNIISEIFKNKNFANRLLLITGDHGMRIGGGHGGSSEEELTVPLLLLDKKCSQNNEITKEYNQIDLTPTLAILMSVEIPKPSIGGLIPELLHNFTQEERLYAYFYNTHHLMQKASLKYGESNIKNRGYSNWFDHAQIAHKDFIEARRKGLPGHFYYEQALKNYQRVSDEISNNMSKSLVQFDYGLIGVGVFLTTMATVYTVIFLIFTENRERNFSKPDFIFNATLWIISLVMALILNTTSQELDLISANSFQRKCLYTASICIGIFIMLSILREFQKLVLPLPCGAHLKLAWSFPQPLLAAFILTVLLLGSSSFIEFEHRTWHYLGVSCILWLIVKNLHQEFYEEPDKFRNSEAYLVSFLRKNKTALFTSFTILSILRFLSVLNATSNRRWATWLRFFKECSLSLLFIGSLVCLLLIARKFLTPLQRKASICVAVSILLFRGFQGKVVLFPEGNFGCMAALGAFWIFLFITGFINLKSIMTNDGRRFEHWLRNTFICSLWLAALLHQTHNVVLLPCMLYTLEYAYNFCDTLKLFMREPYKERYKLACKTFFTIFIANMFFFYQGNSNSLATIDLNPGYIGQSTYNPVIVAIFVTLNTYSAPINAFLYFALHLLANESRYSLHSMSTTMAPQKHFSNFESLSLMLPLYTAATLLPAAFYLVLMIVFRYHLFIYSVFAPKVFYECYRIVVFFVLYCSLQIFVSLLK